MSDAVAEALHELLRAWHAEHGGEQFPETPGARTAHVEQQLLYERWLARDAWRLRSEALPLLLGCDPAAWAARDGSGFAAAESRAWECLRQAVASGELAVVGERADPAAARVAPEAIHAWALRHRLAPPPAFDALLQFILTTVRRAPAAAPASADPRAAAGARERLLGAALNIVSKWPDEVRDANGFIDGALIVERMQRTAAVWFEPPALPLPRTEAIALIERWLV
ncbi:MAG: hypothetical protein AB7Q97_14090 [Gammaproteobacteria bacterium]